LKNLITIQRQGRLRESQKKNKTSRIATTNMEKENLSSSSIFDGIFGVIVYVLIILLCIYFLGDYGYERGPRFFGDPG